MIELNKDNFDTEVLQAKGVVFVDFWSPKCESCMALMPDVEAFVEKKRWKGKILQTGHSGQSEACHLTKGYGATHLCVL